MLHLVMKGLLHAILGLNEVELFPSFTIEVSIHVASLLDGDDVVMEVHVVIQVQNFFMLY